MEDEVHINCIIVIHQLYYQYLKISILYQPRLCGKYVRKSISRHMGENPPKTKKENPDQDSAMANTLLL